MSGGRVFFKNDLFNLSFQMQQNQRISKERDQKALKQKKSNPQAKKEKQQKQQESSFDPLNAEEAVKLNTHNFYAQKDIDDELKQLFSQVKSAKKSEDDGSNKLPKRKMFFTPKTMNKIIEPKSQALEKLTIREQDEAIRKQKRQFWKMGQQLKKTFRFENKEQQKRNVGQKQLENTSIKKSENDDKDCDSSVSAEKLKKKRTTIGKKKKIKKEENFVRQDLKKKYKDRFVGALGRNIRALQKKRKMKRYGKCEIQITEGQLHNTYINSLSKALYLTFSLDDDSQIEQQKLEYTIPTSYDRPQLQKLIKDLFGFQSFRQGQYQTVSNILCGKSTLFVSETASGKSLTYILSSIILKGLSIVVSPLISLMLDQLQHLPSDLPAACMSSLLTYDQKKRIIDMTKQGKIQLLFVTPETFLTDFMFHIKQFPEINFVCIDQAHSLSELSHSFRASYLCLQQIVLKYFKYKKEKPVVLCLTATANQETMESISQKMHINETIRSKTIINKNLFITVSRQQMTGKYVGLLNYLAEKTISRLKGILIYCRTKKIMFQVYNYLKNSGIGCSIYHSGLEQKQKIETMDKFRSGSLRIVIATVALGMGLDFGNLQCVIHINMPKSIQNYVQQIGRAGRRKKRAYCHLFLDKNDYYVERNYFIADQLEPQIYQKIIFELKKKTASESQKSKDKQKDQEISDGVKSLKRLSLEQPEQKSNSDENIFFQDDSNSQKNRNQQGQKKKSEVKHKQDQKLFNPDKSLVSVFRPLSYYKSEHMLELTGMKKEAILNILVKIQKVVGKQSFAVLPLSHQTVKIGFFKNNKQEIIDSEPIFKDLIDDVKNFKGMIYIPLIKKCNQLEMTPIQLLTTIYSYSNKYALKIELVNEIFIWQTTNSVLKKLSEPSYAKQVMEQFNIIQRTSLTKFNIFYSVCFNNSNKTLLNIINNKLIRSVDQSLPEKHIVNDFDDYFKQETYEYYQIISADGSIEKQHRQQDQEAAFLPLSAITQETTIDIGNSVDLFLKHILMTNDSKKFSELIQPFRDGRTITRVFMGVNDSKSSWKIYGQHTYWMRFKDKDYRKLLKTVREAVLQFLLREGPNYLEKQKTTVTKSKKKQQVEQSKSLIKSKSIQDQIKET